MPPKPAPKLTKAQLKALAEEQKKKKQQQDKRRQEQEQQRLEQEKKMNQVERLKLQKQEAQRIANQRQDFSQALKQRKKNQNKLFDQLKQNQTWSNTTTQYYKSYDVGGTNLSTFMNIFRDEQFKTPEKTLQFCQQSEIIVSQLHQVLLRGRAQGNQKQEQEARQAIRQIHKIEGHKLQQIMIWMANQGQDMEEKNNQLTRNKNQPNRKVEGRKLLQYLQFMTTNFKIGMFLNSTTTKTVNKFRPIEIKEFGLNTQIPSKWINANTVVKFEWVNFDPFQTNNQKDSFKIVGGVYNLEFYELLMGSKKINNITLKKHYKAKEILQKFKLQTSLIKEPFQLQYKLPSNIYLSSFDSTTLQFAQYDMSENKWIVLPNDTVQEYDPVEKKVICKVARPEPIAYIQDRCHDYPYVAWELRSIEDDKVLLDIELKRYLKPKSSMPSQSPNTEAQQNYRLIVTFEIQDHLVKLSLNENIPQLADICTSYRTPEYLLAELSKRGIHLLPDDSDYLDARVTQKNKQTEQNAIRDISYAVESFYIRSQPNETDEIRVKIRQNLDHESIFLEDQQKDWKRIHWKYDRCWVSNRKIKEKHLNLENLLQKHDFCGSQCLQRIKYDRKYMLRKTVMKILSLTRILSFTTAREQQSRLKQVLRQKILIE